MKIAPMNPERGGSIFNSRAKTVEEFREEILLDLTNRIEAEERRHAARGPGCSAKDRNDAAIRAKTLFNYREDLRRLNLRQEK